MRGLLDMRNYTRQTWDIDDWGGGFNGRFWCREHYCDYGGFQGVI